MIVFMIRTARGLARELIAEIKDLWITDLRWTGTEYQDKPVIREFFAVNDNGLTLVQHFGPSVKRIAIHVNNGNSLKLGLSKLRSDWT